MASIGNSPTQQAFTPAIDYFSGNGSTTAFTLSRPVASVAQVQVVIDNVAQNPSSAYTVSANTITFTSAPLSGTNNIYVYYTSPITQVIAPGQGTVGLTSLNATGTASASTYLRGDNTWATVATPSAATQTALGTVYGETESSGASTTALGYQAFNASSTGTLNTAVGWQALTANTSGNNNTAVGEGALTANTTGSENVSVGLRSSYTNQTGSYITAVGRDALRANTTSAMTAVGYQALYQNTSGSDNVAVGYKSMFANTTGYENVAIGNETLLNATTGDRNTALGNNALRASSTPDDNTAVGWYALRPNTTGYANTAVGSAAGVGNTTGYYNTAVGSNALGSVTTGAGNTAVGEGAGGTLATNNNCTFLGQRPIASGSNVQHEIVIGCNTTGKGSNTAFINANSGATYNGGNTANWNTTSDQRLKKNIVDNTEGLNIISQIRVRNFEYRTAEEVTELPAHTVIDKQGVQLGVIAQELQEVCSDCVKEESTGVLSVDTSNLTWHMINAIKDLKAKNDALTARIEALENR